MPRDQPIKILSHCNSQKQKIKDVIKWDCDFHYNVVSYVQAMQSLCKTYNPPSERIPRDLFLHYIKQTEVTTMEMNGNTLWRFF